jgi:hypothetical protein
MVCCEGNSTYGDYVKHLEELSDSPVHVWQTVL